LNLFFLVKHDALHARYEGSQSDPLTAPSATQNRKQKARLGNPTELLFQQKLRRITRAQIAWNLKARQASFEVLQEQIGTDWRWAGQAMEGMGSRGKQ
jgi:hypothetical protein